MNSIKSKIMSLFKCKKTVKKNKINNIDVVVIRAYNKETNELNYYV